MFKRSGAPRTQGVAVRKCGHVWEGAWWEGDTKRRKKLGDVATMTEKQARAAADLLHIEVVKRGNAALNPRTSTLRQWRDAYEKETVSLDYATLRNQLKAFDDLIAFAGENTAMSAIGPEHVRQFAAWLAKRPKSDGTPTSLATIASAIARCSRVFAVAHDRSEPLIARNPFKGRVMKELRATYSTKVKADARHVSMDEYAKLMAAADKPWQRAIISLARLAGLRRIEATKLAWSDVNFGTGTIIVRGKIDAMGREVSTSKLSRRIVPMAKGLRTVLQAIRDEQQSGYGPCDGIPATEGYHKPLVALLRRSGVEEYGKPLHALRAACINDWMDAGHQLPDIAEWAGHSLEVMMNHYRERGAERRLAAFGEKDRT
jgi:integrase